MSEKLQCGFGVHKKAFHMPNQYEKDSRLAHGTGASNVFALKVVRSRLFVGQLHLLNLLTFGFFEFLRSQVFANWSRVSCESTSM